MKRIVAGLIAVTALFTNIATVMAASQQLIGTYYESYTDAKTCAGVAICTVSFSALPAGKNIIVKRVTCKTTAAAIPYYVTFGPAATNGGNLLKRTYLTAALNSKYITSYYYTIFEGQPDMMLGPGRFPTVSFYIESTTSNIYLECALTGVAL